MRMQAIYEAILDIDILAPPSLYVESILHTLCERLHYAFGAVIEVDTAGQWQTFAAYLFPDESVVRELQTGKSPVEPFYRGVLNSHELHIIQDFTDRPAMVHLHAAIRDYDIRTVVMMPLFGYGRAFGICQLFTSEERKLTVSEQELLWKIAEVVSVAILRNQNLSKLHQRTKELCDEIAERQRVEEALREALQRRRELEEIINRSPVVVFLWRAVHGWPVEFVSRSIEQFGHAPEELIDGSVPFLSLVHPDDLPRLLKSVRQHLLDDAQEFVLEFRIITKSGETRWVESRIWTRHDNDGHDLLHIVMPSTGAVTHLQGIMLDITERKHAEELIRHQAYHDTLTDLPNRSLFSDRLITAIAHARRQKSMLAVMFLDLDRFKSINDTLGHSVGDQLLQAVAKRLRSRLREEDTISRLGGDEFTILLPQIVHQEDAAGVAQKIIHAFDEPFTLEGTEIRISTSIGISIYPNDGSDAQTLLKNADEALYQAKEEGRNTYRLYSSMIAALTIE